jgi:hypothetical protein
MEVQAFRSHPALVIQILVKSEQRQPQSYPAAVFVFEKRVWEEEHRRKRSRLVFVWSEVPNARRTFRIGIELLEKRRQAQPCGLPTGSFV